MKRLLKKQLQLITPKKYTNKVRDIYNACKLFEQKIADISLNDLYHYYFDFKEQQHPGNSEKLHNHIIDLVLKRFESKKKETGFSDIEKRQYFDLLNEDPIIATLKKIVEKNKQAAFEKTAQNLNAANIITAEFTLEKPRNNLFEFDSLTGDHKKDLMQLRQIKTEEQLEHITIVFDHYLENESLTVIELYSLYQELDFILRIILQKNETKKIHSKIKESRKELRQVFLQNLSKLSVKETKQLISSEKDLWEIYKQLNQIINVLSRKRKDDNLYYRHIGELLEKRKKYIKNIFLENLPLLAKRQLNSSLETTIHYTEKNGAYQSVKTKLNRMKILPPETSEKLLRELHKIATLMIF